MKAAISLLLLALAAPVAAHETMAGNLHIDHPSIPEPNDFAKSAAGYMTITNTGETAEELIGVRTSFAESTTLHTTIFEGDIAKMRPIVGLPIGPGETVALEPGGMHVMFMGLTESTEQGDLIPATLIFRDAGEVDVEFMIDPVGAMGHGDMDHSEMDHGDHDHSHN